MAAVFLHVGLPKTGTTSIQAALEDAKEELSEGGTLFPGGSHRAQRQAAFDLIGQRVQGARADAVPGAFRRMMAEIRAYEGDRVVVSDEELGLARASHVRRVMRALSEHEVYVVVGVRDLGRTLVSAWQQGVLRGDTGRWRDFVEAVRDPSRGDIRTGASFQLRHDVCRVLHAWGSHVPADRIRIVTVPPPGAPTELLLARFAAATGLPATFPEGRGSPRNQSPGPAQVEAVRRLNVRLAGRLDQRQHRFVVERGIRPGTAAGGGSRPLRLPREDLDWVSERSEAVVDEIRRRGHDVFGELEDLLVTESATSTRRLDELSEAELLAATEDAVESLALAMGSRSRRTAGRVPERRTSMVDGLASFVHAAGFRLEKSVLIHARRRRLLARLVRNYLRRSSTTRRSHAGGPSGKVATHPASSPRRRVR